MDIRKITDELSVAPQIKAAEVPAIAAAGFRSVICNRPDGESSDQPCCSDIEAAVKAHGLVWRSQPVQSGGVTIADAQEFGALLAEHGRDGLHLFQTIAIFLAQIART